MDSGKYCIGGVGYQEDDRNLAIQARFRPIRCLDEERSFTLFEPCEGAMSYS